MNYLSMSENELKEEYDNLKNRYDELKAMGFSVDMSRGKPSSQQLELSEKMIKTLKPGDLISDSGVDTRNYGGLDGLPEMKKIFADMLEVKPENVIVGGNSSLTIMYDTIARAMSFGIMGSTPWSKLDKVKFLCPVPGYDRHFAICELFGIEMINIPMDDNGPDMNMIKEYVENDESVKGIWCVPKYSNPTGNSYSDETVEAFSKLNPKADDFRIFWDNAYCVHDLTDTPDKIKNILEECKKQGKEDMVFEFTSTSKISFSGAGVAAMVASVNNVKYALKQLTIQTIGPNKINQLMHVRYFKDLDTIKKHMQKHRKLLYPKFKTVLDAFDTELNDLVICKYTRPNGGYFISFTTMDGCAKRVGELCKDAGLVITNVGATYPYGKDPDNNNIRIAPTFPPVDELKDAVCIFTVCVKLATLEKLLGKY